jgi:hypothetical protein
MGGPLVAQDDPRLVAWSSGVILASGARGPGLSSGCREENAFRHCAKMGTSWAETQDRTASWALSKLSCRGCCEGQGASTALDQAKRPMLCHRAANGWPSSGAWKT